MMDKFLNISNTLVSFYNNLIKLTTNKKLYSGLTSIDTFSDRLLLLLFHFSFILFVFNNAKNKLLLQKIYDYVFRQIELGLREIGYGDQSINKKMKNYINLFHSILSKIHFWNDMDFDKKQQLLNNFLDNFNNIEFLVNYFDNFTTKLKKYDLNSYLKSVNKP